MSDTCKHDGLYWYAAPANEQGWRCADCGWQPGEPPGFSPAHDRSRLWTKVWCIVHDLHEAKIIYVSNGSGGDALSTEVARECQARDLYDSVSIARVILEHEAGDRHAGYWRGISEGILAGKDPRPRCACGQLATMSACGGAVVTRACSNEHMDQALGRKPGEW